MFAGMRLAFLFVLPLLIAFAAGAAPQKPKKAECPAMVQTSGFRKSSDSDAMAKQLEAHELRLEAAEKRIAACESSEKRIAELEALVKSLLQQDQQSDSDTASGGGSDNIQDESLTEAGSNSSLLSKSRSDYSIRDSRSLLSRRTGQGAIWDEVKKLWGKVKDLTSKVPGLITKVADIAKQIKISALWNEIKKQISNWGFIKKIKNAFNKIKKFAMKGINFFKNLYDKYLKPIINHIGSCAKDAGNPLNFIFCMLSPVVNKIMQLLIPAGDITKKVPFPKDKMGEEYDFDLGKYIQTNRCIDCDDTDARAIAPQKCRDFKKELGMGTFEYKICDAPFGMDPDKKISDEIKANLWACNKKASVFREDSPWTTIYDAVTLGRASIAEAQTLAAEILNSVRGFLGAGSGTSTEKDMASKIQQGAAAATRHCSAAMEASTKFMVVILALLDQHFKVPGKLQNMLAETEACRDELAVTRTHVKEAKGTTLWNTLQENSKATSALQVYKTALTDMIDTVNNATSSIVDLEEDIEERMRAVAVPDFKSLVDLPVNCAKGKGPYMKVYASFEGNSVLTGSGQIFRLSLHQRTGFKFAWNDFSGFNDGFKIKSIDYSWEELLAATTNARNSYQKLSGRNCATNTWTKDMGTGYTVEECQNECNKYPMGDGSGHCSFIVHNDNPNDVAYYGRCRLKDGAHDGTGCSNNNNLDVHVRSYAGLDDSPGVEQEICYMLFCIRLSLKLTQKMRNIMGVDLPNSMNLDLSDDVYFFTFDLKFFDITLKKLSIPVTLSVPIDDIFPSMLVPFIVTIPTPVTAPAVPAIQESRAAGPPTKAVLAKLKDMQGEESVAEQQKASYYVRSRGDASCPDGNEILSQAECEAAVAELGLCHGDTWTGSSKNIPAYCSHRPSTCGKVTAHFNSQSASSKGRSDLAPVCKQPGTLKQTDICGAEDSELGNVDAAEGDLEDDITDDDME